MLGLYDLMISFNHVSVREGKPTILPSERSS
jgi:hypothetical protein